MNLADRIAAEDCTRLRSFGVGSPDRLVTEVAGLTVVLMGVNEAWGVQVEAMDVAVEAAAVDAAVAWCRAQGRDPLVRVRARDRDRLPSYTVAEELPVLVAPVGGVQDALAVDRSWDLEEFRNIYAESFGMAPELAAKLVVAGDLDAHPHLLGRSDGRAVACAQLRPGAELAYVNGVGVLPSERGRGFGAAMMTACAVAAGDLGCSLIWLHASQASVGFYEAIGFELVDTHLALAAS